MDKLIDLAVSKLAEIKADGWEIMASSLRELSLGAKDGAIETLTSSSMSGLAVRIFDGTRTGLAYTYDLSPEAVGKTIGQAAQLAQAADGEEALAGRTGPTAVPGALPEVETVDPELEKIPQEQKAALALQMEAQALAFDKRVVKVRRAEYEEESSQTRLVNSTGLDLSRAVTMTQVSLGLLVQEGRESQMGWEFDFSPRFSRLKAGETGRRAAERAVGLLGAGKAETGRFPAVFDNLTAAQLVSVLSSAFLGESVQRGKSLLAGRMGKQVFAPTLDIIDDGLLSGGAGTRPFDDEGTPQQRTILMEEGRLTGLLYDRLSAAREGVSSTGNAARASLKAQPGPGVTNLFIAPGKAGATDLIASMDKGFLITDVMGLHTADPISGDFSFGASGHWVEGGKPVRPVQGAAISGNLVDLLGRVEGVGSDLRFLGGAGAPSLLFGRLDIAG